LLHGEWSSRINSAWRKTIEGVFETGRLIVAAEAAMPPEQFQYLVKNSLLFDRTTAWRLKAIAKDQRLVAHVQQLPASWGTLYEITKLPDEEFQQKLARGEINPNMQRKEITGINYALEQKRDAARVKNLVAVTGKVATVVIDPPHQSGGGRGLVYAPMSPAKIQALPLRDWLVDGAHVYVCATTPEIRNGFDYFDAWGVDFKQMLTWVKTKQNGNVALSMGWYFRHSTEFVLFGTYGETRRTRNPARSIPEHFVASIGAHSEKPEKFYDIVRAASYGPYGEVFQRKPRPDFTNLYVEKDEARRAA